MFPEELMQYPQWVCWKYAPQNGNGKPTKYPFNPRNGKLASTTDPETWSDYDTAARAAAAGYYNGIGFVLSSNDPFTFIDLDDPQGNPDVIERHRRMIECFDSYTETSPSGNGAHILVKASVPNGRRRNCVEIYSSERYFTMTGWTIRDKQIEPRQDLATMLWSELGGTVEQAYTPIKEEPEKFSDEEIWKMAKDAQNGQKFLDLWEDEWGKYYPSQSEAAFGLIDILSFYSRNTTQIKRMFYLSAIGKREKWIKRPRLIDDMIKRSFDNQLPEIPLEAIKMSVAQMLAKKDAQADKNAAKLPPIARPEGLLGELQDFIYASAPRPVKEIALAAAIGFMAGICGRSYNVSGTGLNQYVLILAKTGTGKEAVSSGIDKLMQEIKKTVPAALDFIGPAEIASGQALIKYLGKNPCFVSIVGEFGLFLQEMCSLSANVNQIHLRKTLLALYNKSGNTDILRPIIYSDKDKNTEVVKSPAFSLLGESIPETFYSSLDQSMIEQGLLPRFLCIEYHGDRPPLNPNHKSTYPSVDLIRKVAEVCVNSLQLSQYGRFIEVILSPEARNFSDYFNLKCDNKINSSDMEVERQLWNRGHIKTLKLAALVAIGVNPYQPVITDSIIQWAASVIERDILNILLQFETGKAGRDTSEVNQINEVVAAIKDYLVRPWQSFERYRVLPEMHRDKVVSVAYLQRRLISKGSFKNDRIGATNSLDRALRSLENEGAIRELRSRDLQAWYQKTMKAYLVTDPYRFV